MLEAEGLNGRAAQLEESISQLHWELSAALEHHQTAPAGLELLLEPAIASLPAAVTAIELSFAELSARVESSRAADEASRGSSSPPAIAGSEELQTIETSVAALESKLESTAAELTADIGKTKESVTALAEKTAREAAALQTKIAGEVEVSITELGRKVESTAAELAASVSKAEAELGGRIDTEVAGLAILGSRVASDSARVAGLGLFDGDASAELESQVSEEVNRSVLDLSSLSVEDKLDKEVAGLQARAELSEASVLAVEESVAALSARLDGQGNAQAAGAAAATAAGLSEGGAVELEVRSSAACICHSSWRPCWYTRATCNCLQAISAPRLHGPLDNMY